MALLAFLYYSIKGVLAVANMHIYALLVTDMTPVQQATL